MTIRNTVLKLIVMVALVAVAAAWSPAQSKYSVESSGRSSGMVGIAQSQTARFNLVNLSGGEFVPCIRVEMAFVDSDGSVLSQKVYDIDADKSASLDLRGSEVVGRGSNRAQIRAEVRLVGTPDTLIADGCIPTLEVFDNESGETRFLLPAVQKVQKVSP